MNGKRQRDNDLVVRAALSARGECWPQSRIDSLEQLLDRIREHALSKNHLDGNPLEIIVELLSTNQEALAAELFPSWPCMSPKCAELTTFRAASMLKLFQAPAAAALQAAANSRSVCKTGHFGLVA